MFLISKLSEIDPRGGGGGGQHFSNKSEIQKKSEISDRRGGKPVWENVQKFSVF